MALQQQEEGMEDDSSSTTDVLRFNWTPPMDRYFIQLLLDQVHKGNKTATAFTKEAWVEMIVLFIDKFQCKHDTDVLKNRYKQYRKQYNNVKTLTQNGFHWNENRQMVIADDKKWDDYAKDHPEMLTYRTKVLPYYNELFVICGHAVADGRYSLSCFDVDYEHEAGPLDDNIPMKDDSNKVEWSETMDQHFIRLMLDEVQKGNKSSQTFKNKAWVHMITEFNTKFGFQYGKLVLKSRFNVLKRQYSAVKFLIEQKGFSWDETQLMILAEDLDWKKAIKEQRYFQRFRDKRLSFYEDMRVICGNEILAWGDAYPANKPGGLSTHVIQAKVKDQTNKTEPGPGIKRKLCPQKKHEVEVKKKKLCPQKEHDEVETKKSCKPSLTAQKPNKSVEDALQEMVVAVATLTNKKKKEKPLLIEDVIDILQAMPDIDDDLLLEACDFLEDDNRARMFLALDANLRKKWLVRKLRLQ